MARIATQILYIASVQWVLLSCSQGNRHVYGYDSSGGLSSQNPPFETNDDAEPRSSSQNPIPGASKTEIGSDGEVCGIYTIRKVRDNFGNYNEAIGLKVDDFKATGVPAIQRLICAKSGIAKEENAPIIHTIGFSGQLVDGSEIVVMVSLFGQLAQGSHVS